MAATMNYRLLFALFLASSSWLVGTESAALGISSNINGMPENEEIKLLTDAAMSKWHREAYPASGVVSANSPWSFDPKTGILSCAASGVHEMLLFERVLADGVFHVEWRYIEVTPKANSGVFVRTARDASNWIQAQLAPPGLGRISGLWTVPKGTSAVIKAGKAAPNLMRSVDEWNTLEIVCRGADIAVIVNGVETAVMKDVGILKGHVGLEAEFTPIEFRNLWFKPTAAKT